MIPIAPYPVFCTYDVGRMLPDAATKRTGSWVPTFIIGRWAKGEERVLYYVTDQCAMGQRGRRWQSGRDIKRCMIY